MTVPSPQSAPRPTYGHHLRAFLRMLDRRKWLLVGTSLLPTLLAAAILSLLTPEYTSTVRIAIDPASPEANQSDLSAKIEAPEFLNRAAEKIKIQRSSALASPLIPKFDAILNGARTYLLNLLGIQPTPDASEIGRAPSGYSEAAQTLRTMLSISVQTSNDVFTLSVQDADRTRAKRAADILSSLYVEEASKVEHDANIHMAAQTSEQLGLLKRNADTASSAVVKFRAQSGISGELNEKATSQELASLNSRLIQTQAEILDRQSRIGSSQSSQSRLESREGTSDILNSPVIAALRIQESDAARRVAEVSQRYGETHPRIAEAKAELGQVRGAIAAEVKKIVSSRDVELAAAQSREKQLQDQLSDLRKKANLLDQNGIELRQLERIAEKEDASYRDFLRHSNELAAERAGRRPAVLLLTPASQPESPSYPRYRETLVITLIAGLVIGLAWICFAELLDSGLRTGDQIERLTGRTLIGMIPALTRSTLKDSSPIRFVIEKPLSAYAEALRSVRTSISLASANLDRKVIMITSSVPGEGKSTFSCSLARLMARSNPTKKVVIVDCDLRRSSVQKLLAAPDTGGTIDQYLTGTKALDDVLGREDESGLFYLPAQIDTENSAELLASEKMHTLIDALKSVFDLVVLDTPPLMAISDPRVIVPFADYVVFLIHWEKTERDLAIAALKLLPVDATVGVVLSQVNLRKHARYGYADYGTYYSKYSSYYTRA